MRQGKTPQGGPMWPGITSKINSPILRGGGGNVTLFDLGAQSGPVIW